MDNLYWGASDRYLFHQGTNYEIYNKMGAHLRCEDGVWGVHFVLWAPNAQAVCVLSDGNGWTHWADNMEKTDDSCWELFIPGMTEGTRYRYLIRRCDGYEVIKSDPYAFRSELRPANASVVADLDKYQWQDGQWQESRVNGDFLKKPMSVYEVHLGSWKKDDKKTDVHRFLDYRRSAHELADYIEYMGYTHIELMGICEYPFDPSWGYQVTCYYAPTSRYGTPEDFMYFVDLMHRRGIGVILDWVPAHFPKDYFGLSNFDGTPLYEYADPLRAEYPEWGTVAFDHGKPEVANFLIGSAFFWVNKYHIDALRVDAVAAMLYNNFSREQWRPNIYGGNENLESQQFFRHLNSILRQKTNAFLIAEDSSTLKNITMPAQDGGFGFGLKWNMGWMNDTLRYLAQDPIYRKYHHELIAHTLDYNSTENFILVLSHDEVVYGKGSMYGKVPGSKTDKLRTLKTLYTFMMGHPGKKLLFMGQDFGQEREWDFNSGLDWYLCDNDSDHRELHDSVRTLLNIYRTHPVLYTDGEVGTFEWINRNDADRSIFSFLRRDPRSYDKALVFVCNYTPVQYSDFRVGAPAKCRCRRIFSTYADTRTCEQYTQQGECDGRPFHICYELLPFESAIFELSLEPSPESAAQAPGCGKASKLKASEKPKGTAPRL